MSATTAQLQFGIPHPNDGGLHTNATMLLIEGDRPAWLVATGARDGNPRRRYVWIPTLEFMLEDGLLMAACLLSADTKIREKIRRLVGGEVPSNLELYSIPPEQRDSLYEHCREFEGFPKLALVVFVGSHIITQLSRLRRYKMEVELCYPVYTRLYSAWDQKMSETGDIPSGEQ